MLILITIFFAIGSTFIVHPWFLRGIFNNSFIADFIKFGFKDNEKVLRRIIISIIIEITFVSSIGIMLIYVCNFIRNHIYILTMLSIVFIVQIINQFVVEIKEKRNKNIIKLLIFASIFLIIPIQNKIVSYDGITATAFDKNMFSIYDNSDLNIANDLKEKLDAKNIKGPICTNSDYIFLVEDSKKGDGIAVYEKDNFIFYKCNIMGDTSYYLRNQFPYSENSYCNIIIKNNIPYAKYAILEREYFFSRPTIQNYVLIDLSTGKISKVEKVN